MGKAVLRRLIEKNYNYLPLCSLKILFLLKVIMKGRFYVFLSLCYAFLSLNHMNIYRNQRLSTGRHAMAHDSRPDGSGTSGEEVTVDL
jgi:hypothetical protein